MDRKIRKYYDNELQSCSLFFEEGELAASLTVDYKKEQRVIDLVVNCEAEIYAIDRDRKRPADLRCMYKSTKELYDELNKENSFLEERYTTWFNVYVDGQQTDEILYEVEELELWSDKDITDFLDEFDSKKDKVKPEKEIGLADEQYQKFEVEIVETTVKKVPIYARDKEDAKETVKNKYANNELPDKSYDEYFMEWEIY